MENYFKDNVKQIILDHLDDEHFGVGELAAQLGLSRSQTYRKVKSHFKRSVTKLIKETRLQQAAKLILEFDLHASEISYKVGFSSPSYFNKCFHKYFGITPGEYKENPQIQTPDKQFTSSKIKKLQIFFYVLGTALLLFGIISLIKSKTNPPEISIAVLYFDDHSPNSDKQWLCSAITEQITSKLSGVKNLKVTSRTSVKRYRNTDKSIPEIAKELGVDYILEGSITLNISANKIKIIPQLINAKNEHVWYGIYNEKNEDIFAIQEMVAKQVMQELKIELSPEEEKEITYRPTKNFEAQQLYSEGLSHLDLVSVENLDVYRFIHPGGYAHLKISDSLFRQAIFLDPNYAEATAELAFVLQLYWEKASKKWTDVKFKEIDSIIDRSLEINPNAVRAYTTRGLRQGYNEGNWEKAKEYFEKAIEIKPNDAANQLYYALYFAQKAEPDYKKALEHINIAQRLNPHSTTINYDKIIYLLNNNKFTEAEEFYRQKNSFFTESLKSKIKIQLLKGIVKKLCLEKKDWTEAIKFYHEAIEKQPQSAEIHRLLAECYDEILNDAPNFLKYAEKAFELDTVEYIFKRTIGFALVRNKKFKEHLDFLKRYRKSAKAPLYTHYYFEQNFEKAQIYMDMFFVDSFIFQANMFAQQNKVKEAYEILNKGVLANYEKARVFAILKERDSMYHYINKEKDIYNIREFNSYFEVDPYRNEKRYKSFLKKNYLPTNE